MKRCDWLLRYLKGSDWLKTKTGLLSLAGEVYVIQKCAVT